MNLSDYLAYIGRDQVELYCRNCDSSFYDDEVMAFNGIDLNTFNQLAARHDASCPGTETP